ncbi:MAG TPA: hypothetical protein VGF65_05920, partial [Mycobacterium sp.]
MALGVIGLIASIVAVPVTAGAATDISHDADVAAYVTAAQNSITSAQGSCLVWMNHLAIATAPAGKTDTYYTNHFETADLRFISAGHTCAASTANVISSHTVVGSLQQDPLEPGGIPYDSNLGTGGPYGDETNVVIGWP